MQHSSLAHVRLRLGGALAALLLFAPTAPAASIDYVSGGAVCHGQAACGLTVDGVLVTLRAQPADTRLWWDPEGLDGIGIHPGSYEMDEIEAPEWLAIEFSQPVLLTAVHLTDLFYQEVSLWGFSASPAYNECGWYTLNGGPALDFCQTDPTELQVSALGAYMLDFGAGTLVTSIGMSGYGVTWYDGNQYSIHHDFSLARLEFAAIPEPATLSLVALGLGMAAWRVRRRS